MIFKRANELRDKINFKMDIDGYEICVSVRHNFEPNWKENLKFEKRHIEDEVHNVKICCF